MPLDAWENLATTRNIGQRFISLPARNFLRKTQVPQKGAMAQTQPNRGAMPAKEGSGYRKAEREVRLLVDRKMNEAAGVRRWPLHSSGRL
jgi:hypothetical protein